MPIHDAATSTLPPWARDIATWFASALSMASALGLVNLIVGLLSASWIATQLYRYWRFEHRQNLAREARRADPSTETPSSTTRGELT